ncbi:hypothetical protein [Streptomyces luteogriseus]|uniref:hypothetical protein n=1 Tax=Streptomyces luteogriseus TaxID=68233 RepID=UPI0027D8FF2C|nr:hypothetical protein [Streptomyces luteogriseus]
MSNQFATLAATPDTALLAHADDLLPDATKTQLRFLAERLTEALRDILRVVESRNRKP